mgnify:CR=1 FL=1
MDCFKNHPELKVVTYKNRMKSEKKADKYYKKYCDKKSCKQIIMNSIDVMHAWWMSRKCTICAWGYVYERKFLIDNNLLFPDYSHGEDQIFVLKSMLKTDKVGFLKMIGYVYIVHKTSTSNAQRTADKFWNEHSQYRDDYYKLVSDKYPAFYTIAFLDYLRWYVYRCARLSYKSFRLKIKEKEIKNIPVVFGTSIMHTIASLLFNISKRLFWIMGHYRYVIRKKLNLENG